MVKQKQSFKCTNCNYNTVKWLGCCPDCKEWNSFAEHKPVIPTIHKSFTAATALDLVDLNSIPVTEQVRMISGIKEWDRVLGGGIMPSSFLILTGDPGIGKSTLMLQISNSLAKQYKVFYFSSEESLQQIKMRAQRLHATIRAFYFLIKQASKLLLQQHKHKNQILLLLIRFKIVIPQKYKLFPAALANYVKPHLHLMRLAKENNITVIVSGHITKEGNIAGPKLLEHMVDGVFYLQGEDRWQTRVFRSVKNRFGTINEFGFFEMDHTGMQEVPNINQQLLNEITYHPGSALVSMVEGSRPLLIEVQALTIASKFGIAPTRNFRS